MITPRKLIPLLIVACTGLGGMYRDDASQETKSQNNAIVISGVVRQPNDAATRKRLEKTGVNDRSGVAVYVVNVPKEAKWDIPKEPIVLKCGSGKMMPEYACIQVRQPLQVTWEKGQVYFINVRTLENPHLKLPEAGLWDRTKFSATFYRPEDGVIVNAISSPETAYVTVVPNPFHAVTQSDGSFRLPRGLSPGKYTVKAFHPKLGTAVKEVRFSGDRSECHVEFELGTGKEKEKIPLNPLDRLYEDKEQPASEEKLERLPREQP